MLLMISDFNCFWIVALLIHVITERCSGTLSMLTNGQLYVVDAGQPLQLDCQFHADVFNLFEYPVLWRKYQLDDHVQINTMGNINEPFLSEDRFDVSLSAAPPRYSVLLSIASVSSQDSANYSCELRGPQSNVLREVTHFVSVRVPVHSVRMAISNPPSIDFTVHDDDATSVTVVEHQPTTVRCVALGGYPPPRLEIHVIGADIEDVTSRMSMNRSLSVSGRRGLRTLTGRVQLWTYNYVVSRDFDGHLVNCVAAVAGLRPVTHSVRLNVIYAPEIICQRTSAFVGERDVVVVCHVISKPPAIAILWQIEMTDGHDQRIVRMADRDANVFYWSTIADHHDNGVVAQLIIRHVTEASFKQRYTIFAENIVSLTTSDAYISPKYQQPVLLNNDSALLHDWSVPDDVIFHVRHHTGNLSASSSLPAAYLRLVGFIGFLLLSSDCMNVAMF